MNNRLLTIYIRAVVGAGGAVLLYSAASLGGTPRMMEWFIFSALAIVLGRFMINIGPVEASMSVADTLFIASAMLFGPEAAALALAVDSFLFSYRKRHDRTRTAFNTAAPALSMWVAARGFFALSDIAPALVASTPIAALLTPLLCLTVVYYLLNSGLTAVVIGLATRQSPMLVWRHHFLSLSLNYVAAGSLALCLILIVQQVGLGAVAVVLPVLAIFHLTLRASFGRLEDAQRHVGEIDRLYKSTVETLAMAIDAKDDVTHSHVRRVQAYATALARELNVGDALTIKAIEAAALLHDTGKLAVPERILNKPGKLTSAEFEEMKRHVDVGADILALVDFPYPVVPIVRCHHENWDGTGYPRGVSGTDIPIGARILSVVDCFDALTSDRPYRPAMTHDAALDILRERRGRMYDPDVVDAFIRTYREVTVEEGPGAEHREVLQQISRSADREPAAPIVSIAAEPADAPPAAAAPIAEDVLAFVSLSRLASGAGSAADVLALASTLVHRVAPRASGVWLLLDGERLAAVDAFGARAASLRGLEMRLDERLSGWVASTRQAIVNSDGALDLGDTMTGAVSCTSVPLLSGDQLIGVLTLYADGRDGFTEDEGRVVQMIAPHVAQALQSAARLEPKALAPTGTAPVTATGGPVRDLKLVASR